jgi:isoaspartyl peptidase/L-asparaginase-like protein (Ntn-hydrolase superfamily)
MEQRAKGKGGLIAIDKHGNFGKCCSTDVIMVWASIKDDEMKHGIEADTAAANVNST